MQLSQAGVVDDDDDAEYVTKPEGRMGRPVIDSH